MLYIFYQIVEDTLIFELKKGEIFGNFAFSHDGYFLIVSGSFLKIVPKSIECIEHLCNSVMVSVGWINF